MPPVLILFVSDTPNIPAGRKFKKKMPDFDTHNLYLSI